jgi:hypothetical protein
VDLGAVLAEQRAVRRLGRQVVRQVVAGDDRLQVVRQQEALGALAATVVVHDAALEAEVDEVAVGGVTGRLGGRQAPDLQVEQGQQAGVAAAIRERIGQGHGLGERLGELDRLAFPAVRRVLVQVGDDVCAVGGAAGLGRRSDDAGILGRERGAADGGVRQQPLLQQVQGLDAVALHLEDVALEELGGRAHELERSRGWQPERVFAATLVEVVPDLVVVDPETGLLEVALVLLGADGLAGGEQAAAADDQREQQRCRRSHDAGGAGWDGACERGHHRAAPQRRGVHQQSFGVGQP